MTHLDLSTLPIEHPLRNWPLADIDAECGWKLSHLEKLGLPLRHGWKPVKTWKLAAASYNELGPVWHVDAEWRVSVGG